MSYESRKWVIITLSDYTDSELQTLINNALETDSTTLRKSIDKTQAILKWDGNTPSVFSGMTTYTHSEILEELKKSTWTEEE